MMICQGCGQNFDLPEGYTRNKIQCPGCGVICPVAADAPRASAKAAPRAAARRAADPEPAVEDQAAAMLKEPEPLPLFDDEPEPEPPPPPKPKKQKEALIPCRRCGRKIRRQRECPSCDGPQQEEDPQSLELPEEPPRADEEDDSPYDFSEKELPTCPKCKKDMPQGATLCTSCGFDLRTRRKAVREYETIAKTWESDMSLEQRLKWIGVANAIHWSFALIAWAGGRMDAATAFLIAWPFLTLVLCWVLGTYDKITLLRDRKGRAKVIKQWRTFFVPLPPVTTELRGYEGVTTGQWHDAGFLEWFVFVSLLPVGIVPAIIWWYNAIHKQHFHVALAMDHGHSEYYLYRGRNEGQMNDIADSVANAAGMRRLG